MIDVDDFDNDFLDDSLDAFETYDDYLNSLITPEDLFYLEDLELAQQLKEEGYHAKTEILTHAQFDQKKKEAEERRNNQKNDKTKALAHSEVTDRTKLDSDNFLKELAKREEQVLNGRLLTIIFIRYETKNTEISGYIDYCQRLKTEDFKVYFEGKKKLLPKPSDLSYYNWRTKNCVSNDSPNFKVDALSGQQGLLFRNKRDRKVINVDPKKETEANNMIRIEVQSDDYTQIVFFDHQTRKKNA